MYKHPKEFEISSEVKAFIEDCNAFGVLSFDDEWYVTPEWSSKFRAHLSVLLLKAEEGEPWSQYHVANLYLRGYLYSSARECKSNQASDVKQASLWLEKAARQGLVIAADNLAVDGIGPEAERLRAICRVVEKEFPEYIDPSKKAKGQSVSLSSFFEEVWDRAYGD